jgi:hypothetical protein
VGIVDPIDNIILEGFVVQDKEVMEGERQQQAQTWVLELV